MRRPRVSHLFFPIFKLGGSRVDFLVSLHSTDSGGLLPHEKQFKKKSENQKKNTIRK